MLTDLIPTGREDEPHSRYQQGGLRGPRLRPERPRREVIDGRVARPGVKQVDIGVGRGSDPGSAHTSQFPLDALAPGPGSYIACHVSLVENGASARRRTELFTSLFVCLISIRKCVYPVLCYNQCISFVAIEKYVDSLDFLFLSGGVLGAWGMECPVSVSGAIRKLQSWCGEPLSRGWPPLHGEFGRMGVGKYYCSISNIHILFLQS